MNELLAPSLSLRLFHRPQRGAFQLLFSAFGNNRYWYTRPGTSFVRQVIKSTLCCSLSDKARMAVMSESCLSCEAACLACRD